MSLVQSLRAPRLSASLALLLAGSLGATALGGAVAQAAEEPLGSVSGTVTDVRCNPVRTAVYLMGRNESGAWTSRSALAVTDEQGRFEITGMPAGEYVVAYGLDPSRQESSPYVVEYSGDALRAEDATPLSLEPGERITDADAQLVVGGLLAGTVRDEENWAVAWWTVRASRLVDTPDGPAVDYSLTTEVAYNGHFSLDQLPTGTYQVEVGAPEQEWTPYPGGPLPVQVETRTVDVDFQLTIDDPNLPPFEGWPKLPDPAPAPSTVAWPRSPESCSSGEPAPSPTPSPTASPTTSPSSSPSPSPTAEPSATPPPSPTVAPTATPTTQPTAQPRPGLWGLLEQLRRLLQQLLSGRR